MATRVVLCLFAFWSVSAFATFKQVGYSTPQSASSSVSVAYPNSQSAGDLNVVIVGWNDTTASVSAVSDSLGNTYSLAIGPTSGTALRQSIYYAKNIKSGTNTVKITFTTGAKYPDVRILEYSGMDTVSPLDKVAGTSGSGSTASTASVTTTVAGELLVGGGMTNSHYTGAGSGYTQRVLTSPDADIAEDRTVTSTGTYNATAPLSSGNWVFQLATFKAAGTTSTSSPTPTPAPSPSPSSSGVTCGTGCNNYYVNASTGSDSNNGTSTSTAWKSISHAVAAYSMGSAGAVIHVAPGTYSGFNTSRGGISESARLKIVCTQQWTYPSSTAGCHINSTITLNTSNYIDIGALPKYGFDIKPPTTSGSGIVALSQGTNSGYSKYVHIYGNFLHDFAQDFPAHTMNGISYPAGCPSSGAAIVGSHPNTTLKSTDAIGAEFVGNRVENYALSGPNCNQAHGIYATGSHDKILSNLVVHAGGSSIQFYDSDCFGVISGNTVVNGYLNGILVNGPGFCAAPGNNTIRNNIVVGTNGCGYGSLSGKSSSPSHPSFWANNLSYNNSGGNFCQLGADDTVSGTLTSNPLFSNTSTGDYHLQSTSPALHAGGTSCVSGGLSPCVPTTDLDGVTRSSTTPSLGAYEQ